MAFAFNSRAQPINQRVNSQRDRVAAGQADGQLTNREARQLRADDRGIKHRERAARRAGGGRLTPGQRNQLQHELNQNSRQIHRERMRGR